MKNKKGFTLIELLAIIVILAIIAVITVPVILNIIENSKKGAATDSAYGYKDAIDKFYVSKLSIDSGYNIPDGLHTLNDFDSMGVTFNGKKPAGNSFLKTVKNKVTQGCLQYDEYKVEFIDGRPQNAQKGTCKTVNIVYVDVNENGKIDLADTVKIENDEFYVLDVPFGGKVKLLPKYNLNSDSRQASSNTLSLAFSNTDYWTSDLSSYPIDENYTYYIYTRDTTNNMYSYIENYKNYLIELGAYFVTDARPMSFEEAKKAGCKTNDESSAQNSCPSFFGTVNFWLGSVNGTTHAGWLYYYHSNKRYLYPRNGASSGQTYRVRPVIEINESAISDNYTLTFDSQGGTSIDSRNIVVGANVGSIPVPEKLGATFEGWYTDKGYTSEKLTTATIPSGSTTYYAKYILNKAEYTDSDGSGTINLGDSVRIVDDEFYVIAAPSGGKVRLITKYNLNTFSRQASSNTISLAFGDTDYWTNSLSSYPIDGYSTYYIYTRDTSNNMYSYINNYSNYLNSLGAAFITDVRLMSFADAIDAGCKTNKDSSAENSCPSFFGTVNFWLGSVNGTTNAGWLYYYHSNKRYLYPGNGAASSQTYRVRPVIVINESALQ